MRFYPQTHSLRRVFPDADERELEKLHHALKRNGYPPSIIERMTAAPQPVLVINSRHRNGHKGGIYTQDGRD